MKPPEIIAATLTSGDVALFVNGHAVLTLDASSSGENPAEVGKYLAKALGVELQEVNMEAPKDADWSWSDVHKLLPATTEVESTILVSLDGGLTFHPAPEGVRIIYKNVILGDDILGEVHINATDEGLITDIWRNGICEQPGSEPMDFNVGTDSVTVDEIVSRLMDEEEGINGLVD